MATSNKILMFSIFISIFVITVCDGAMQKISRIKCEEYGNIVKSHLCNTTSGTQGPAKGGDYPHMALLGYNTQNKIQWSCTGVLISDQYILTVAHCFIHQNPSVVRLGDLNIKSESDNTNVQDIKISEIIKHPDYKNDLLYNDIALIKLEKPVQFNQYVRPACLPDVDEAIDLVNQKFIKSGWPLLPKDNVEQKPYLSFYKNVNTIPYETCKNTYSPFAQLTKGIDENSHLCLGQHEGQCQIISGSPIQIHDKNVECMYRIIGLVSFAFHKCEENIPEVSTKVSTYVDWIENKVWA